MIMATLIKEKIQLGLAHSFRRLICHLHGRTWQCAGRYSAGEKAEKYTS